MDMRNNWLKIGSYQWTLTPSSSPSTRVFSVSDYGYLNNNYAYFGFGARPSIYLKSNIAVLGGDGSRDFPYIIK